MRDTLDSWVIYDHPTDFPEHYVARKWIIDPDAVEPRPTDHLMFADDLHELRTHLGGQGFTRVPRQALDDPKILEVWL